LARDVRAHIGFVEVVGGNNFDLHAFGRGTKVLDRLLGSPHGPHAGNIGVEARLIVHDADLDGASLVLRDRGTHAPSKKKRTDEDCEPLVHA
jgi:hypothetical protein